MPDRKLQLDRYRLESLLGRGGMGEVWSAFDWELKRHVAVKLMVRLDSLSDEHYRRFRAEAQTIAQLRSPYVVHVYDHEISREGIPYTVMELLEGEDLEQRLWRVRTMSVAGFWPIFKQVAKALEAAHGAGIVHRDLKPANVFLAHQGGELCVKVLDFGVAFLRAHWLEEVPRPSAMRKLVGTPEFMSPEQAADCAVDHRTDLWALAVMAYRALTGRSPFASGDIRITLRRIRKEPHQPPSKIVTELGKKADAFFAKALAKPPGDRFQTLAELVTAFEQLAPGMDEPQTAKILVVDDEPDMVMLFEDCFAAEIASGQYELLFAQDGRQALDILSSHPEVMVALTDLKMPVMDGMAFLAEMDKVAPAIKRIVVSAYGDIGNIRRAMNRGAFDFLIKPIDFDDLAVTVRKAVRQARQLRRALLSLEENTALRALVDDKVVRELLPLLGPGTRLPVEVMDATVLSLDVAQVAAAAPAADEEQLIAQLNRIFDSVLPLLSDHRGTVVRFYGSSLLALFCEQDHIWLAVFAAMLLPDRLASAGFSATAHKVGIATGKVTTAAVGAPSRQRYDYVALGPAVSHARRLRVRAPVGGVVVCEAIARTLGEAAVCQPLSARDPELRRARLLLSHHEEHFPAACSTTTASFPPPGQSDTDPSPLPTLLAKADEPKG